MSFYDDERIDGHAVELMCADLLRQRGYIILAQNYECGHLELDLVVLDRTTIAFIEVKARRSLGALRDLESLIPPKKQLNILAAAKAYLRDRNGGKHVPHSDIRFDYLLIYIPPKGAESGYKYIKNAIDTFPEGYETIDI